MNGRIYDPALGRMLSADPIVQSPLNSQSWNRYSYVINAPLNLIDPAGFTWDSVDTGAGAINGGQSPYEGGYTGGYDSSAPLNGSSSTGVYGDGGLEVLNTTGTTQNRGLWWGSAVVNDGIVGNSSNNLLAGGTPNGVPPAAIGTNRSGISAQRESPILDADSAKGREESSGGAYIPSSQSQMTQRSDGNWQYRENAAFEAAGLSPSTQTNDCTEGSIRACAVVATLLGAGDNVISDTAETIDSGAEVANKAGGWFNRLVTSPYYKTAYYFSTWGTRYVESYEQCSANCGKQGFER